MKHYRKILLIAVLVTLIGLIYKMLRPEYHYEAVSPDKKYRLEVYKESMIFTMPGGGSDNMAKVILRDSKGKFIGESSNDCSVMFRDINIVWDYPANCVWFAPARTINLATGKCEY